MVEQNLARIAYILITFVMNFRVISYSFYAAKNNDLYISFHKLYCDIACQLPVALIGIRYTLFRSCLILCVVRYECYFCRITLYY